MEQLKQEIHQTVANPQIKEQLFFTMDLIQINHFMEKLNMDLTFCFDFVNELIAIPEKKLHYYILHIVDSLLYELVKWQPELPYPKTIRLSEFEEHACLYMKWEENQLRMIFTNDSVILKVPEEKEKVILENSNEESITKCFTLLKHYFLA
jgi:hypothetical protein